MHPTLELGFHCHPRSNEYLHSYAKDNAPLRHTILETEASTKIWDEDTDTWALHARSTASFEESTTEHLVERTVGQLNHHVAASGT